jgi:hypothetical protein
MTGLQTDTFFATATVGRHVVVSVVDKRPCEFALVTVLPTGTFPYKCSTAKN